MKAISHLTYILKFNWQNTVIFYEMLWQNLLTDVRKNCNSIDNDKTCKTDDIANNSSQQNKIKFV